MDELEELLKRVAAEMGDEFTRELSKAVAEYGAERYAEGEAWADEEDDW